MHITTDGIVLRERPIDEFDSILTLLTKQCGVITAYARGARKPRSALRAGVELLSFSCFVLFCNKRRYSLDKADVQRLFMGVRGDVEKLSLAAYFCQIAAETAPREEPAPEQLRLLLNCLYLLDQDKRSCFFLKPVYELRMMAMSGYMPDLVACKVCGCYEAGSLRFDPVSGTLLCAKCAPAQEKRISGTLVAAGALAAMRHILYAQSDKLFSFSLPPASLEQLNEIAEEYVCLQLDKKFETLDFYKNIRRPMSLGS